MENENVSGNKVMVSQISLGELVESMGEATLVNVFEVCANGERRVLALTMDGYANIFGKTDTTK